MKNIKLINVLVYVLIIAMAFGIIWMIFGNSTDKVPYSQVLTLFEEEQVKSFRVENGILSMELHKPYKNKDSLDVQIADVEVFRQDVKELLQAQTASGVLESYDFVAEKGFNPFSLVLPALLVGLVLLIIWAVLAGRASAQNPMNNFGKARTVNGLPSDKKPARRSPSRMWPAWKRKRPSCRRSWISCEIPRNMKKLAPGSPTAFCWQALPAPARRSLPGLWQGSPMRCFCLFPALTSWRCMWAWVPAV